MAFDAFSVQLHAAFRGDWDRQVEGGLRRIEAAGRYAVATTLGNWQGKLRQDLAASGLARGAQLAKTWRMRVYPRPGTHTLSPAGVIYSTMPKVVLAFEQGATVTVHGKRGALVPNPEVWGGRLRRPAGRGAAATSSFDVAKRAFGKLQFVASKSSGGGKLLGFFIAEVEHGRQASRRRRSAGVRGKIGRKTDQVVVFWVLHEPRLPRLLHGGVIRTRFNASAPGEAAGHFVIGMQKAIAGASFQLTGPSDA